MTEDISETEKGQKGERKQRQDRRQIGNRQRTEER
jgi:hypothetical protein